MQDWSIPLIVATAGFLVVLLWQVRPMVGWGRQRGASRAEIRAAHERIESAKSDEERAMALCDAADLLAPSSAKGLYLRAIRANPSSVRVIERVVAGLRRRPRALESVLWRHLASSSWTDTREATRAALEALRVLYEGPLRRAVRAKAMANARDAMK